MYVGILYASMDLKVYPNKVVHHLPTEPNPGRLTRVLRMCQLELYGDPYVEDNRWIQPVRGLDG